MPEMYAVSADKLEAVADAIRLKRDITTPLTVDDMPLQIGLIESGGSEPLIDEVFFLPERTTSAQTIRVDLSKTIDDPKTHEMYAFLMECLEPIELTAQEKILVFRKLEADVIHSNPLFMGSTVTVANSISTSGVLSFATVYGTQTTVGRLTSSYLNINHPTIQTANDYKVGNWRIRGWKIADAPEV